MCPLEDDANSSPSEQAVAVERLLGRGTALAQRGLRDQAELPFALLPDLLLVLRGSSTHSQTGGHQKQNDAFCFERGFGVARGISKNQNQF